MTSIFDFLRGRPDGMDANLSENATVESMSGTALAENDNALIGAESEAPLASALTIPHGSPSLEVVLATIRAALELYLPPADGGLPDPNVSIIKVEEKPTGLGNYIRDEKLNAFSIALKGGRLQAVIRFQLWAGDPNDADQAIDDLHGRLLAAKNELYMAGFLRFAAEGSTSAEHIPSLNNWRRTADYQALYEFQYTDTDEARSLIARIPIHTDPERRNSPNRETTIVTDEMVRWDNESAPILDLHGRLTVSRFSALLFIPGSTPSGPVRLLRTFDGAAGSPATFPDLNQFVAAVNNPTTPERYAQLTFASLSDFLAIFSATGDPITLGDWDEDLIGDNYLPISLVLPEQIIIPAGTDHLQLIYQPDNSDPQFDQLGILYIRAGPL